LIEHLEGNEPSPTSPFSSGVYTSATITYSSTVDTTITTLSGKFTYDRGVNTVLPSAMPILILMHGYAGDTSSFLTADMQRFASYGFFTLAVGMRGRNSATGSADASAREIYDILDALTYVRSNYSGVVSSTKAVIVGYSGGGGNALSCLVKCPDYFSSVISLFGISDYGYRPTTGWYGYYSGAPALLDVDIGARASGTDPYLARLSTAGVLKSLSMGGFLGLFHDASDSLVSVEMSRQVVSALSSLTSKSYQYNESTSASSVRWLHGHPNDHPTEMQTAEKVFIKHCRDSSVWSMPSNGSIRVNGWFKSRSQDFEIWLGDASSPKTNGTGGRNKVSDVDYDATNGIFVLTPITTTGTMYVTARVGASTKSVTITDATKPTVIEIYSV